jgi:hypothetical protein
VIPTEIEKLKQLAHAAEAAGFTDPWGRDEEGKTCSPLLVYDMADRDVAQAVSIPVADYIAELAPYRVLVLADRAQRWSRLSDALRRAFVAHASEEGVDCCGKAFAGVEGAEQCATWKGIWLAVDKADA